MNEIQHLANPRDRPAPRWFHVAVAFSMVVSAISALVATLHTGRTMTALVEQNAKLVRAGSTPVLEFRHGNAGDGDEPTLGFFVRNVGSGMARVVWFELRLDGRPMPDMQAVIEALQPDAGVGMDLVTGSVARRHLAPGAEQRVLRWVVPPASRAVARKAWNELNRARFNRIEVQACFCSVFEECWTSRMVGDVPQPSPGCVDEKRTSLRG